MKFYCSMKIEPYELKEKHGLDIDDSFEGMKQVLRSLGAKILQARPGDSPDTWDITWHFLCEFKDTPPSETFGITFHHYKSNRRFQEGLALTAQTIKQLIVLSHSRRGDTTYLKTFHHRAMGEDIFFRCHTGSSGKASISINEDTLDVPIQALESFMAKWSEYQ